MTVTDRITEVLRRHGDSCTRANADYLAQQIAELPIVLIDTDNDSDPFYAYQEEMTHIAKVDRVTYGQWIKRELEAAWSAVEEKP